jgi:anthranilate synthase component 1
VRHRSGLAERLQGDPVHRLAELQARYRAVHDPAAPPFSGGGVGYVSYDAIRWVEKIPLPADPSPLPWLSLGFYDTVVAFDHLRHRLQLVALGHVTDPHSAASLRDSYDDAVQRLERLAAMLDGQPAPAANLEDTLPGENQVVAASSMSESQFCERVERIQHYIRQGDAFQVVLSRRLTCATHAQPLTVYRALRAVNPSPYMFCLDAGAAQLVGSSPEMLVRVENGIVETRPIAGTRRRDPDPEEDARLERELLADEKERAEHLMLVDLGRNDVGRVAEYGSIDVAEFMQVERYSHVMHLVSSVRGRLREGLSPAEAMFASFPAGTVSGAPKIRAMEIINELEGLGRGPYAGAVLYSDFAGNLNSCITIRTVVMRDGVAEVQAGAGVVMDSRPEREFEETGEKAAAALQAIGWADATSTGTATPDGRQPAPTTGPGTTGGSS